MVSVIERAENSDAAASVALTSGSEDFKNGTGDGGVGVGGSKEDYHVVEFEQTHSAFQTASKSGALFQPVSLAFMDVIFSVPIEKDKKKVILDDVGGYIQAGTFVAIMGPTGSGKTSLLNVLAGRVGKANGAELEGQILLNGRERANTPFKRLSAYVLQDDLLFSTLTVWETVLTAAMLRLPSSMSFEEKRGMAERVIAELGLTKARDTPIGNAMIRGVSGGERKRTNIAVEMLSNPSLIFLDEPTSGLDSFQALNVMSSMADLAKSGRTVISTIHQPRSSIFALFDDLLLLSEGKMIYFGKANKAVDYFASKGYSCPSHFNPADYFMDVISMDRRDEAKETASAERIKQLSLSYSPSSAVSPALHLVSMEEQAKFDMQKFPKYASSLYTQFFILYKRSIKQALRDRVPLFIAYAQTLVMMTFISILYSNMSDNQKSIQDKQGAVFFISIFLAFNGVFQMIITFPLERIIVNRERASNSYSVAAYYPAKVLSEWPLRVGPTVIFCLIAYWPVNFQREASKFFLFLLTAVLEFTSMNAVGLFISSLAPTPETAIALGPLITVIFMLFGGFYVNLSSIPVWIRWFRNVSPIQWGFIGLAVNEFSGRHFTCDNLSYACIQNGEDVLKRLSITEYSVGQALGYQCCLIVGLHTLAFLTLYLNGPKSQSLSLKNKKNNGTRPSG